jgi:predicted  nucleic acid-binding Zn-ribbon protein
MPKLDRKELPHNSKVTTHQCLYCAITFYASKPFAKYCSDKCRVYFNQKKKIEKEMREAKEREAMATADVNPADNPVMEVNNQQDNQGTSLVNQESREILTPEDQNNEKTTKQNKKGLINQLEIEW